MSFVIFPVEDKAALIGMVIGTQGLSPDEEILGRPGHGCKHLPEDEEGIIYADIDLNNILRTKAMLDLVGHYSRPDIFCLHINKSHNPFTKVTNKPEGDSPSRCC